MALQEANISATDVSIISQKDISTQSSRSSLIEVACCWSFLVTLLVISLIFIMIIIGMIILGAVREDV